MKTEKAKAALMKHYYERVQRYSWTGGYGSGRGSLIILYGWRPITIHAASDTRRTIS